MPMKKKLLSITIAIMILSAGSTSYAEGKTLEEAVNAIWIEQYPELCDKVTQRYEEEMAAYEKSMRSMDINAYKYLWGANYEGKLESDIGGQRESSKPVFSQGYQFYNMPVGKYSVQYAKSGNIDYLLDESWLVHVVGMRSNTKEHSWRCYDGPINKRFIINAEEPIIPSSLYDFVRDVEGLEKLLQEAGAEDFIDFKVIAVTRVNTVLYFKYSNGEYGILIKDPYYSPNPIDVEQLKVYDFSYILQKIGKIEEIKFNNAIYTADMLDVKPTYEVEATALQEDGLLQGNDNGLDLLKPLTRAEAVALLVRALGLESQTANYTTSMFADIPSDNWAAPYAALAKELGITDGINDTDFAPDQKVTSDQFATFTLRAAGESGFDYTEGTEILIDKGLITIQQSATMDLFTRGDMAKIIYESREKGLF